MLDLRLLKTFLAVAAGRSFKKAAEGLNLAPSTVTAQIKALEHDLGFPLFDRPGRGVLLTEQGQRLLRHARRLLDMEAEARRSLGADGEEWGELTVRVSESLGAWCMPAVVARFRADFPHTRLTLGTASRQGLARDLSQGFTDLALLLSEPFTGPGIEVEALSRQPLAVIAPPGAGLPAAVRPEDLGAFPLFLTRYVWSARRLIEQALHQAHVRPAVVECSSVEIVKRCVMEGLGVSVVPGFAVEEQARAGRLDVLRWAGEPLFATVLLARSSERWLSPAAARFMEAARRHFAQERGVRPDAPVPAGGRRG